MDTSNNNHLNILDLPNEILLIIFTKLNMIDVLYSLVDVNERFDRLILTPFYTHHLDLTIKTTKPAFYRVFPIDNKILDRITEQILPRIDHHINKLTVEPYGMERALLTTNYHQLYSLKLVNFPKVLLFQYLTGNSILQDLLRKQITHLEIGIQNRRTETSEILANIFASILSLCKQLIELNFSLVPDDRKSPVRIFNLRSTTFMSSTLTTLKINVSIFNDCLYILEERFDSLSALFIHVQSISDTLTNIDNVKKLPKLKRFSLTSFSFIYHYEDLIISLLRRMINIKELILYLLVGRFDSTYIDGTQLHDQILISMPHLNKFTFSIYTYVVNNNNIRNDLPSNEDIQRSFIGRRYGQVGSYTHIRSMEDVIKARCHIYSIPYDFEYYFQLKNFFPGGRFHKVRHLVMNDTHPFQRKLFQVISQDFPFLENLSIHNCQPQEDKQEHLSTAITFPYLTILHLGEAHLGYVEQLLVKKNAHLPCLLDLHMEYESLAIITRHFTIHATDFNFAKLKGLNIDEPFVRPENFQKYFPLLM